MSAMGIKMHAIIIIKRLQINNRINIYSYYYSVIKFELNLICICLKSTISNDFLNTLENILSSVFKKSLIIVHFSYS